MAGRVSPLKGSSLALATVVGLLTAVGFPSSPETARAATASCYVSSPTTVAVDCFGRLAGPLFQTSSRLQWEYGDQSGDGRFVSDGVGAVPSGNPVKGVWSATLHPRVPANTVEATVGRMGNGAGVVGQVMTGVASADDYILRANTASGRYDLVRGQRSISPTVETVIGSVAAVPADGDVLRLYVPTSRFPYLRASVTQGGTTTSSNVINESAEPLDAAAARVGIQSASANNVRFTRVQVDSANGIYTAAQWGLSTHTPSAVGSLYLNAIQPSKQTSVGKIDISNLSGFSAGAGFALTSLKFGGRDVTSKYTIAWNTDTIQLRAATSVTGANPIQPGETLEVVVAGLKLPSATGKYQPNLTVSNFNDQAATPWTGATTPDEWTTVTGTVEDQLAVTTSASSLVTGNQNSPNNGLSVIDTFARADDYLAWTTTSEIGSDWKDNAGGFQILSNALGVLNAPSTNSDATVDLTQSPSNVPVAMQGVTTAVTLSGTAAAAGKTRGLSVMSDGATKPTTYAVWLGSDKITLDKLNAGVSTQLLQAPVPAGRLDTGPHRLTATVYPDDNTWDDPGTCDVCAYFPGTTWTLEVYVDGKFALRYSLGQIAYDQLQTRFGLVRAPSTAADVRWDDFSVGVAALAGVQTASDTSVTGQAANLTMTGVVASDGPWKNVTVPAPGALSSAVTVPTGTYADPAKAPTADATGNVTYQDPVPATAGVPVRWTEKFTNPAGTGWVPMGTAQVTAPGALFPWGSGAAEGYAVAGSELSLGAGAWAAGSTLSGLTLNANFAGAGANADTINLRLPPGVTGAPSASAVSGLTSFTSVTRKGSTLVISFAAQTDVTAVSMTLDGLTMPQAGRFPVTAWVVGTDGATKAFSATTRTVTGPFAAAPTLTVDGGSTVGIHDPDANWTAVVQPKATGFISSITLDMANGTGTPVVVSASGFRTTVSVTVSGSIYTFSLATPSKYAAGDKLTIVFAGHAAATAATNAVRVTTWAVPGAGWNVDDTGPSGGLLPTYASKGAWSLPVTWSTSSVLPAATGVTWTYVYSTPSDAKVTLRTIDVTVPSSAAVTGPWTVTGTGVSGTWSATRTGDTIRLTGSAGSRLAANTQLTVTAAGVTNPAGGTYTATAGSSNSYPEQWGSGTSAAVTFIQPTVTVTVDTSAVALAAHPGVSPDATAPVGVDVNATGPYVLSAAMADTTGVAGTLPRLTSGLGTGVGSGSTLPSAVSGIGLHSSTPAGVTVAAGAASGYAGVPAAGDTLATNPAAGGGTDHFALTLGVHAGMDVSPGAYSSVLTLTATLS